MSEKVYYTQIWIPGEKFSFDKNPDLKSLQISMNGFILIEGYHFYIKEGKLIFRNTYPKKNDKIILTYIAKETNLNAFEAFYDEEVN